MPSCRRRKFCISLSNGLKMIESRKFRVFLCSLCLSICIVLLYLAYICPDQTCYASKERGQKLSVNTETEISPIVKYLKGEVDEQTFNKEDLHRDIDFNAEGEDVFVFLHMQKTGGTSFGKHLVRDLMVNRENEMTCPKIDGRKKYDCRNSKKQYWIFSRYSTGWLCGLHADFTELRDCVGKKMEQLEGNARNRRLHYITVLRDPVARYLSEWKHVERGATWKAATLKCNGREATVQEVPFCYDASGTWAGVSLDDFMSCEHNLGNNRQTRMLADLSKVGCYNKSVLPREIRENRILESAKENLKNMDFFGMTEYQTDTQYLFENTFHLEFVQNFVQLNVTHVATEINITEAQRQRVMKINHLDIKLYLFAKDLFFQRVKKMRSNERNFSQLQSNNDRKRGNTNFGNNSPEEESDDEKENLDSYQEDELTVRRKLDHEKT